MYKERYKTTKFIDFVNFKDQKSSQFIIILALILRVTVLIQQIFNFLLNSFCRVDPMGNAMRELSNPIPSDSHGKPIPMNKPVCWTIEFVV